MTAREKDEGVPEELPRLRDLPPDQDLAGVGELVRAAAAVPELAPQARQRGRARLRRALGPGGRRRRRWMVVRPALLVVAALMSASVGGAAVYSVIVERRLARLVPERAEPVSARHGSGKQPGRARGVAPAPAEATPAPNPSNSVDPTPAALPPAVEPPAVQVPSAQPASEPPAASTSKVAGRARTAPVLVASAERDAPPSALAGSGARGEIEAPPSPGLSPPALQPPAVVAPSAPAPSRSPSGSAHPPASSGAGARLEMEALAEALRRLRTTDDAPGALAVLDELAARFPASALAPEVSALRIEALLKAGRSSAALAELDRAPLDGAPGRDARLVVRGELRGQAGRWREADADFSRALAARLDGARDDLAERALWGRAVARSRLGDAAGAREGCARYLERFPDGRFADSVRRLARSLAVAAPAAGAP